MIFCAIWYHFYYLKNVENTHGEVLLSKIRESCSTSICDALHNLVPFVQFKKREKRPWRIVNFGKVVGLNPATLLKLTLLHGCFSRFLNCTNGTKSRNAPHMLIGTNEHSLKSTYKF